MAEETRDINQSPTLNPMTIDANDKVFVSDNGTSLKKADIAAIAKYIVENYSGSSIAGQAQTPKAALDGLNNKLSINGPATLNLTSTNPTDTLDTFLATLGSYEGRFIEIQINDGVRIDNLSLPTGRKMAQIFKYSNDLYAVLSLLGWSDGKPEILLTKYNGTWKAEIKPTRAEVNALNSNISWHAVPSSVTTKALLQDYIDNQIATNGYFYGYMTAAVSVNVGLGNIGYYIFAEANSTNYRLVQAVSSNNNNKYTMIKFNGTWMDWIPSKEGNIWFTPRGNQLTTDIVTYVENIAAAGNCGLHIFWSSASNYSTVGAPVNSAMYYKAIIMHPETIYIEAYTMGTVQTRKFIKQKFSNTWGEWIQVHNQNTTLTEHPNITDVLTPAQDVTILHSYVSVRNGLVILDCHFSQTSTTKTDRFTFKTGYKPIVLNTNISPIFMYANNAVSDSVLFVNPTTLTIFGATPVANQEYYFRLIYFIE